MGGNDLEGNLAYYGAEAGIENLTSQISQLYQTSQAPNAASLNALVSPANYPTAVSGANITYMNYVETITWPSTRTDGTPCPNAPDPCGSWDIVGSGPDQGMDNRNRQCRLETMAKYENIGVRIEDDYAVTVQGVEHLSAGAPREIAAVEKLMAEKAPELPGGGKCGPATP